MTALTDRRTARTGDGATPAEPLWMLRINPLRRSRLADATLGRLLADLTDAERAVRAAAARCSDELYRHIGDSGDQQRRGRLIALRRAIHNDRDAPDAAVSRLPAVADWVTARTRRRELRERVQREYPDAVGRERVALAGLLAEEDLRRALALVAPEVFGAAERYRAAVRAPGPLPARARKSERGLVQYVTRAMVRTSPLSRFTAVGIATPDPEGSEPDQVRFDRAVPFLGLDRVMVHYVLGGLGDPGALEAPGDPGALANLANPNGEHWVQLPLTSWLDSDGGRLNFLRQADSGMRRMAAPVTDTIRLLLDATAMGPRRIRAVVADLADRSGCSADEAGRTVLNAVRAGILCRCGPEDGAADLYAQLGGAGSPQNAHRRVAAGPDPADPAAASAAGLLAEIRASLPRLADAPAAQRDHELGGLRTALSNLSQAARRPARILVEEDYLVPPSTVATVNWHRPLADLAAAVALLSLFDRLHDVRAALAAAFVERFGSGGNVSLVEHATALVGEVYRRGGALDGTIRPGTGPADGSLDRLHALRQRVLDLLRADIAAGCATGQQVTWDAAGVLDLVADLPERFVSGPLDYGVLVQPYRGQLVFNDAYAGHGMLYGRFLGADAALGGHAVARLARRLTRQYGWDGARVVEDLGLHRLNVNAHVPVLPDRLHADDWYTLRLVHDRDTDTLGIHDGQGGKLRVLTLGAGFPELFPPPLRIATWLVSGGRLFTDLLGDWHTGTGWDPRHTRGCPQLSVGSVVLARRRWYGGAELDEALVAGPTEPDRLLALTRWRARHGVPAEVMLKTPLVEQYRQSAGQAGTDQQAHLRRQKPQYVDLASALCVRVLPQLVNRRDPGYLEEALPAVGDGAHAAEWVVQIGRTPGGPFRYGGTECQ